MIEVRNLVMSYGEKDVLKGLNLGIPEGRTTVVIGRSGIGKSVLLRCIMALERPQGGEVWIDGQELLSAKPARQKALIAPIGMLLQNGGLFDSMNVYDNIAFPLRYHRLADEIEIRSRVERYAHLVEIDDALGIMPKELSGGMRKRAALARAIIREPKYLFYDEPTTGLDPTSSALVDILIRRLRDELQVTTVVVTHDIDMVKFLAENVALLQDGVIFEQATREEAFRVGSPIQKTFLASRQRIHSEHGYNEDH